MPRGPVRRAMLICLILGLGLNLTIALFAAAIYRPLAAYGFTPPSAVHLQQWIDHGPSREKPVGWLMRHRTAWSEITIIGDDTQMGIASDGSGIRLGASGTSPNAPTGILMEMRAGWPLHALAARRATANVPLRFSSVSFSGGAVSRVPTYSGTGLVGTTNSGPQVIITAPTIILAPTGLPEAPIPWIPVWPGFVVNTLAWGLALFLLWYVFIDLMLGRGRRRRRLARGQCLACGYDLRGDYAAGCPECGLGRAEIGVNLKLPG